MAIYNKPTLILMAGHAGTGKTTFSRLFISHQQQKGRAWAFVDKDTVGGLFTSALMQLYTGDGLDRDSALFSEKVRPLEYQALSEVVRDNLQLGTSCIACAPFGRECKSRDAFEAYAQSFADIAKTLLVWSHVDAKEAYQRIVGRAHPMDKYKLDNWNAYVDRRYEPNWVHEHNDAFWLHSGHQQETTALRWLESRV